MTKHGSDKGVGYHNYTTVYPVLFKEFQAKKGDSIRIFELGLGTNDPGKPSSMGIYGRPGASLRGWRELFPNALVYGADIDRTILFQDDRIETFYCDQLDKASIRELWSEPDLQTEFEIIIEDGLHTFEASLSFLENSIECLRPGGFYVIEDISHDTVDRWKHHLQTTSSKYYPEFTFAFVLLPNPSNTWDNNLLVILRSAR